MAVSITTVVNQPAMKVFDVAASADTDVAAVIPHGFSIAPAFVWLVPILDEFYTSRWFHLSTTVTAINLTKANAVNSGIAGAQVRVIALRSYPSILT